VNTKRGSRVPADLATARSVPGRRRLGCSQDVRSLRPRRGISARRLGLAVLITAASACGSHSTTVSATATATATASSGGLTVTLTVTPARKGTDLTAEFKLSAHERDAPGALTYRLAYGDATTDQNTTPTICRSSPRFPAQETWHLTHRYAAAGTYVSSVTVSANCTSDRATATATLTLR
jgi:hypothetical protein